MRALQEAEDNIKQFHRRVALAHNHLLKDPHRANAPTEKTKSFHFPSIASVVDSFIADEVQKRLVLNLLKLKARFENPTNPPLRGYGLPQNIFKGIRSLTKRKDISVVLTDKNLGFAVIPTAEIRRQTQIWVQKNDYKVISDKSEE